VTVKRNGQPGPENGIKKSPPEKWRKDEHGQAPREHQAAIRIKATGSQKIEPPRRINPQASHKGGEERAGKEPKIDFGSLWHLRSGADQRVRDGRKGRHGKRKSTLLQA